MSEQDGKSEEKPSSGAPPQRLQGLATRGGPGGMRGGRFLPNAVGRRSKEERESSAPAVKPQPKDQDPDKQKGRKTFDRKKGRQFGTRAEAAGPLAAPTIASTSAARPVRNMGSATAAGSTGGSGGFRVKAETDSALSAALASDMRIDMSSSQNDLESFVPLRMPKDSVKPVNMVSEATHQKDAEIADSTQTHAEAQAPGQAEAKFEQTELKADQLKIEDDNLYLVQMPNLGLTAGQPPATSPLAAKPESGPGSSDGDAAVKVKDEVVDKPPADNAGGAQEEGQSGDVTMDEPETEPIIGAAGRLGTLRTHASGKLSMVIGDTVYEVIQGTHGGSAEEVMVLNKNTHLAHPLGSVKSRVLVIPDLDSLQI